MSLAVSGMEGKGRRGGHAIACCSGGGEPSLAIDDDDGGRCSFLASRRESSWVHPSVSYLVGCCHV